MRLKQPLQESEAQETAVLDSHECSGTGELALVQGLNGLENLSRLRNSMVQLTC